MQIAATAVTLAWAAAAQAGGAAAGSESTAMLAPRLLSHAASALARHAGAEGPAPQADREAGTATPVRDARAAAQPQAGGLRISRLALLGDERISPLFRAVPGALRDMRERLLTGAAQILHHKSDPVAAPAGRVAAAALSATNPATDPAAEASPDAAPTVRAPAGRGGSAIGLVGRRGDPRPGWNMVADLGLATRTASAAVAEASTAATGPVATSAANRPVWSQAASRLHEAGGSGPSPQLTIGATYRYY